MLNQTPLYRIAVAAWLATAGLLTSCLIASGPARAAAAQPFVPVLNVDFPDAFVLEHQGRWLAYATNPEKGAVNVQMASSSDLVHWQSLRDPGNKQLHDAMPALPAWAKRGYTWAPEVLKSGDGFLLYFTARDKRSGLQCIGVAAAADPMGPFTSAAAEPLVCQKALGGSIDPDPLRDADGQLYLYFKNDGNNPDFNKPDQIFVQRLAPDGLSVTGAPSALLHNDSSWEGRVIEAPTMTRAGGSYALFFSGNDYGWQPDTQRLSPYAIGYAICAGPLGPCSNAPENPILHSFMGSAGCLSGPGHQAVFQAGGRTFIAFHAWATTPGCRPLDPYRYWYIAPLIWNDGRPQIAASLRPAAK